MAAPSAGQASAEALAYSGSASASVTNVKLTIPSGILVNDIVNAGGPTAQVAGDSLGTGSGYAAFPDPGELVVIAPGLATGVLSGGVAGLPPIDLPTLPNYPFFISTDGTNPEASAGSGPYELRSKSGSGVSESSATSGFRLSAVGNAALVTATAELSTEDGGVVSTATARLEGLTIGPLTLGSVSSTATQTMDSSGTVTPTSSIDISGVRIGGLPVSIDPDGLNLGGAPVPFPVGEAFTQLLAGFGITAELMPAQTFEDRVIASALRISMPLQLPGALGEAGPSNLQLTIGATSASLSTGVPGGAVPESSDVDPGLGSGLDSTPLELPASGSLDSADLGSSATPAAGPPAAELGADTVSARLPLETFDLRSAYLTLWACAIAAWIISHLIRRLGVRRPWSSLNGSRTNATGPLPSA